MSAPRALASILCGRMRAGPALHIHRCCPRCPSGSPHLALPLCASPACAAGSWHVAPAGSLRARVRAAVASTKCALLNHTGACGVAAACCAAVHTAPAPWPPPSYQRVWSYSSSLACSCCAFLASRPLHSLPSSLRPGLGASSLAWPRFFSSRSCSAERSCFQRVFCQAPASSASSCTAPWSSASSWALARVSWAFLAVSCPAMRSSGRPMAAARSLMTQRCLTQAAQ